MPQDYAISSDVDIILTPILLDKFAMSNNAAQRKSARLWLKKISLPAKKWVQLTILISFISGLLLIAQLYLLSHIAYGAFIEKMSQNQLLSYFITIIAIVIIRAFLSWLREIVSFQASAVVKQQLRADVITHINRLGPVKSSQIDSGHLITAAMEQVEGLNNFLVHFLPQITLAALMPLAILVFVFPQSIFSGLVLLICAPLIPLFMMLVGWGAESENQKNFKTMARMSAGFLDTLQGLTTLRLFNKAKSQSTKIFNYSNEYRIKTMKVLRIAFLSSAVLEVFSAASIALVAIYLGMGFINAGTGNSLWWSLDNMTLQGALFILLLAPEFFLPLRELSTHYHAKAEAVGAALELQKLFELKPDERKGNLCFDQNITAIAINNLTYRYESNQKPALKDICLQIKPKQKIAIIGPSGAGKTTLLNLLMKFIHAKDTSITINDQLSLNHIDDKAWYHKISWLGQHPGLLNGTIRSNLLLADEKASDEQLWQALQQAQLADEVSAFTNGLDSKVGEQHHGLSGGQAQRLALTRAYLKPCELLLLDEPTASLDIDNEKLVIDSLTRSWQDKTVIMLTHRLSFLAQMDQIIVLDKGGIVEQGHFNTLINNKTGLFFELYGHQQGASK